MLPATSWCLFPQRACLVSAHALGAPILTIAVLNMPRGKALMRQIGVFIVGNLLCATAPGAMLMAARIATAFCNGAFFGIGSVEQQDLSRPTAAPRPSR